MPRGFDRRTILSAAAAAGGALLLPGLTQAQTPRRGGTLRVAMPFNPGAIEPMTGRNLPDYKVLYAVFDNLIDFDPLTLDLQPGLAKAWRWTTPTTLVLDLVDGVTFHDGSPFNAEAVRFNLDRYKTDPRSNVKADVSTLERVDVNAPNPVTLHLNRPNVGLPTILTNRAGCMVSPKSIAEKGPKVDRYPVAADHSALSSGRTIPASSSRATTITERRISHILMGLSFTSSTSSMSSRARSLPARPTSASICKCRRS